MSTQEEQLIELMLELKVRTFSFPVTTVAYLTVPVGTENNAAASAVHPQFHATDSICPGSTNGQDERYRRTGSPGSYPRISNFWKPHIL